MTRKQWIQTLSENIILAQKEKIYNELIYENKQVAGKNEFLFFIKPEITVYSEKINLKTILQLIFEKLESSDMKIKTARIMSGKYLDDYDIISQHYGVINKLSVDAKNMLSADAKSRFKEIFHHTADESIILGSLEIMDHYPFFTPESLDFVWQNSPAHKLAGGTYAEQLRFDGKELFLINGFHPRQLTHFIEQGKSIITFTLVSDIKWKDAREKLIGRTNPAEAMPGSIRNELLQNQIALGLQNVSSSLNGVHLSAGPVEALAELIRFNSDYAANRKSNPSDYQFGRQLLSVLNKEELNDILNNKNVQADGKSVSVFDLTEDKDSEEALNLMKKIRS